MSTHRNMPSPKDHWLKIFRTGSYHTRFSSLSRHREETGSPKRCTAGHGVTFGTHYA
ncbi:hypothetical protein EYZ11_001667 [Aspergillus tanneri]|uniref:Uncharacterized protein n=1 Tax=Aspergillus tanneri TaxID=1220188 RepID=A0A4S3JSR3_9EURO|nr:hypothetical protein EYZ11_001667 [Aspergillus tanneri]